ncbi:melatonin receptor type 1B-like [Protopterus annectens]|uniref:melatonin receptor type 1B-like n=1 Tax=Protopterus annectens TaxID=7888 RepID=UPI001CF9B620|nr:melatonin receptor type 1B-like [Protopterus annectens]
MVITYTKNSDCVNTRPYFSERREQLTTKGQENRLENTSRVTLTYSSDTSVSQEKHPGPSFLQSVETSIHGNYFVVSLSAADIAVAVYSYPAIVVSVFYNRWMLSQFHCRISAAIKCLSCIGSVYNITAMAINRYCCICHSLSYDTIYSKKNTCSYLCLVWILSVLTLLPIIFFDMLDYDPIVYTCTFMRSVNQRCTLVIEFIHFIIPTAVVSFCYLRIWLLIVHVKYRLRQDKKQKIKSSEMRQMVIMFLVSVLFALCWGPYSIIGFVISINATDIATEIPHWVFLASTFLADFNSCLNGVIYGVFNQNFRSEYKKIFFLLLCKSRIMTDIKQKNSSRQSMTKTTE